MKSQRKQAGPGQESVWDYPRPPRLEASTERIRVVVGHVVLAETTSSLRVLETSHPPVYYLPPQDVDFQCLTPIDKQTFCEWKGVALYFSVVLEGRRIESAAWAYPDPIDRYAALRNYVAFYPSKVDACYVNDELVTAQEGDFYGGWITSRIVGPFKGPVGTFGW